MGDGLPPSDFGRFGHQLHLVSFLRLPTWLSVNWSSQCVFWVCITLRVVPCYCFQFRECLLLGVRRPRNIRRLRGHFVSIYFLPQTAPYIPILWCCPIASQSSALRCAPCMWSAFAANSELVVASRRRARPAAAARELQCDEARGRPRELRSGGARGQRRAPQELRRGVHEAAGELRAGDGRSAACGCGDGRGGVGTSVCGMSVGAQG